MSPPRSVEDYDALLRRFAEKQGLIFHPDTEQVRMLVQGLWTNKKRYGYASCPCRLAAGSFERDRDILCPCDYARPDIEQYGQCY